MGRKATSGGVEVRETSIRITFVWQGKLQRETLRVNTKPMTPTAANIKYATRLSADVRVAIRSGTFAYERFFPDSPNAKRDAVETFGALADDWLKSKGQLEAATRDQYRNAVAMWKRLLGADIPVPDLTYKLLASKIGGHEWASAKSANNYLIVLRGIMGFEFNGARAALNPMSGIENLPVVKKLPDPLTADERDSVLADLADRYDPRIAAYFQFAFYSGMRPEEIIALQWGDLDRPSGTIRVQRVRTFKGSEREGSKTNKVRDVDLVSPALQAIETMRQYTFMKKDGDYIFENPVTGKPWHDERSQRDHYWKPTLKRLGVRYRRPYCTRHTYATVALMNGVNPAYIAAQLGHADAKMLFERYAKWIEGADKGAQRAAMEAAMRGDFSQEFPREANSSAKLLISNGKVGRRDWTRTKKPGSTG